ncbi:hypothetical protein CLOP_g15100 [Closterium sp. NIES-67]|nr:hypothetical protein CLOP_g15100 [Closterium sp. NIES-67]
MKVAVVGSGVAGLAAAWRLSQQGVQVTVLEKDSHVGGHAFTYRTDDGVDVDLGFMVFNAVTYPNMISFFEELEVAIEPSDMSFSVSVPRCEWGSNGLAGLFASKRNVLRPSFWRMLREMTLFHQDVLSYLAKVEASGVLERHSGALNVTNGSAAAGSSALLTETLGQFLQARGYSSMFCDCYLLPVCASIWSSGVDGARGFNAYSVLSFLKNHHMLQLLGRPQWLTVSGRSQMYVKKVMAAVTARGGMFRTDTEVTAVHTLAEGGVEVRLSNGTSEQYDHVVMAVHGDAVLPLLGEGATQEEQNIFSAFRYATSNIFLHRDKSLMPTRTAAWSAWNFRGVDASGGVCVTYWLNTLQNLGDTGDPILVTLNPLSEIKGAVHHKWATSHPLPTTAATAAARLLPGIQGKRGLFFCGAYLGYGFHEDGFKAGLTAANALLGASSSSSALQPNAPQMLFPLHHQAAKAAVLSFLRPFIQLGSVQLLERGGTVYRFGGQGPKLDCQMTVHSPAFYWKVATRADLGLADAFVDGDISFPQGSRGLLKFLEIMIANRDRTKQPGQRPSKKKGWWSPALLTAVVGSAALYARHLLRFNNLTNARRNISNHYDLSNDMFQTFLDETMTYSCAIFQRPEEPLVDAQLRKLRRLIAKARIDSSHHVLEIGFGWGSLALETVSLTGCRYTGITLSSQQLALATERVKAAGLQDRINFILCDYRKLLGTGRFDRILSCEMLEAVGHEYLGDFFHHCDRLLAMDGLLVVQVITTPESRYEEYRLSSDFIKEYIFPGCCVPSFAALTDAMAKNSAFSVEEMENIGPHYATTLMRWHDKFLTHSHDIMEMGFGPKFLRTWQYYFVYCAVGFQTRTLGDIQVVYSRPSNVTLDLVPYTKTE